MTAKTAPMKVTTNVEPSYTELLRRARALFARDVETRFEMAVIFSKMLRHKSSVEVAEDTDMTPGGVERIARVADFWGNVRIKPDGAGKRHAPWYVYDRVACDVLLTDEQKLAIKRAAPVRGLSLVRQMINDARAVSPARVDEVVNGDAEVPPKLTSQRVASRAAVDRATRTGSTDDGERLVSDALAALRTASRCLDRLESLSEEDAARVNASVSQVARHVIRLTQSGGDQPSR